MTVFNEKISKKKYGVLKANVRMLKVKNKYFENKFNIYGANSVRRYFPYYNANATRDFNLLGYGLGGASMILGLALAPLMLSRKRHNRSREF